MVVWFLLTLLSCSYMPWENTYLHNQYFHCQNLDFCYEKGSILILKIFFVRKRFTEIKEIPTISWACPKKIGFRNYGQIHHVIFLLAKMIPKICSQVFSLRNIVTWYYFCIFSPYFAIVFMKSILVLYMLRRISPRFDFVLHSYSFANVVPMPLTVFVLLPKKIWVA